MVRHGLPIVVAGMLLFVASCGSEPAPVAEQAPAPNADERRLVREFNALLRGPAIDVRFPVAECTSLPRRTRAELRDSPQRIAAARARLARLRMPNSYDRVRTRVDEGLRLIAEANKLLLAWSERSDDPETGECGQSTDNLRDSAYDEIHDLAKPHLQAFMAKHNPIAAQMRASAWELGAAGLIPRSEPAAEEIPAELADLREVKAEQLLARGRPLERPLAVGDEAVHGDAHRVDQHGFTPSGLSHLEIYWSSDDPPTEFPPKGFGGRTRISAGRST